jgi:hypothetical protein
MKKEYVKYVVMGIVLLTLLIVAVILNLGNNKVAENKVIIVTPTPVPTVAYTSETGAKQTIKTKEEMGKEDEIVKLRDLGEVKVGEMTISYDWKRVTFVAKGKGEKVELEKWLIDNGYQYLTFNDFVFEK